MINLAIGDSGRWLSKHDSCPLASPYASPNSVCCTETLPLASVLVPLGELDRANSPPTELGPGNWIW